VIELAEHAEGVVLPVRAYPGARHNAIRGVHQGALQVAVTQVAEKGKANKAIALLICRKLGIRRSQLDLISGDTVANKRFLVRQMRLEVLAERLQDLLAS
jgi:uncharacterized protein YggU (UPF0235/DUF167 family)